MAEKLPQQGLSADDARFALFDIEKTRAGIAGADCLLLIMNKEAALSIAERDFIVNALREGVRLDGRGVDQLRPLKISFGDEYGHVKLQLGKTT